MTEKEIQKQIMDMVLVQGYGRPTIMQLLPEVSEWKVRKYIKKAKEQAKKTTIASRVRNTPNKEVVEFLRPVKVVSPEKPKPAVTEAKDHQTVVFVGDTHSEFVDERAFDIACQIVDSEDVDILVHVGDLLDFYALSTFSKDPKRRLGIQEDLIIGAQHLSVLTQCTKEDTKRYLIKGNHEARYSRYINNNAPALHDIEALQLENLLGLDDLGWKFIDYDLELFPDFVVRHADALSKYSGYSAKREMDASWTSGISGHTHRQALYSYTPRRSQLKNTPPAFWIENGCLCETTPEYMNNANWQQGLTVMKVYPGNVLVPVLVHITRGRAFYNGNLYKG